MFPVSNDRVSRFEPPPKQTPQVNPPSLERAAAPAAPPLRAASQTSSIAQRSALFQKPLLRVQEENKQPMPDSQDRTAPSRVSVLATRFTQRDGASGAATATPQHQTTVRTASLAQRVSVFPQGPHGGPGPVVSSYRPTTSAPSSISHRVSTFGPPPPKGAAAATETPQRQTSVASASLAQRVSVFPQGPHGAPGPAVSVYRPTSHASIAHRVSTFRKPPAEAPPGASDGSSDSRVER